MKIFKPSTLNHSAIKYLDREIEISNYFEFSEMFN